MFLVVVDVQSSSSSSRESKVGKPRHGDIHGKDLLQMRYIDNEQYDKISYTHRDYQLLVVKDDATTLHRRRVGEGWPTGTENKTNKNDPDTKSSNSSTAKWDKIESDDIIPSQVEGGSQTLLSESDSSVDAIDGAISSTTTTTTKSTTAGFVKLVLLIGLGTIGIAGSVIAGILYYRNREIDRWQKYRTIQLLQAQDECFDLSGLDVDDDDDNETFDLELSSIE